MDKSTQSAYEFSLATVSTASAGIVEANVHRKLQKEFASFLQPHNLGAMEWFVIGYLYEKKSGHEVLISDIAKSLQTTMPYMTNLLKTLAAKGLIEKIDQETDSRTKQVRLLPKAEIIYQKVERDLRNKLRDFVYAKVNQEDFLIYIKVMYALSN